MLWGRWCSAFAFANGGIAWYTDSPLVPFFFAMREHSCLCPPRSKRRYDLIDQAGRQYCTATIFFHCHDPNKTVACQSNNTLFLFLLSWPLADCCKTTDGVTLDCCLGAGVLPSPTSPTAGSPTSPAVPSPTSPGGATPTRPSPGTTPTRPSSPSSSQCENIPACASLGLKGGMTRQYCTIFSTL